MLFLSLEVVVPCGKLAVDALVDLKTDRQRVGLDGFRYFSGPKYGGGTNDDLAGPLQHPLLSGNLPKNSSITQWRVLHTQPLLHLNQRKWKSLQFTLL